MPSRVRKYRTFPSAISHSARLTFLVAEEPGWFMLRSCNLRARFDVATTRLYLLSTSSIRRSMDGYSTHIPHIFIGIAMVVCAKPTAHRERSSPVRPLPLIQKEQVPLDT